MNLKTSVTLVTGASKGIGKDIALTLAETGSAIVVHYNRDRAGADAVVDAIRGRGGKAAVVAGDLGAPEGAAELASAVRKIVESWTPDGKLHALVNNVGECTPVSFAEATAEQIAHAFAVNVMGPALLTSRLLSVMADGGRIVNVSSICARRFLPGLSIYGSAKGAVEALTRNLSVELGPRGITVNAVAPGVTATEKSEWLHTDSGRAFVETLQTMKGIGRTADVADAVRYLVSPEARWVTGQILTISGGA